jgi:hypothetical protein
MRGDKKSDAAIMTSSDDVRPGEFGANAYTKPSAALTVLRETVMGPELFDKASKNMRSVGPSNTLALRTFSVPWKTLRSGFGLVLARLVLYQ